MMAPIPVPDNFNWKGKYFHLTYSGWIPKNELLAMASSVTSTPLEGWSMVHEDTSEQREDGVRIVGYQHTHLGLIYKSKINIHGSRKFDIMLVDAAGAALVVHPNIVPKLSIGQMEVIFTDYHPGRKYDIAAGKKVYKKPVFHENHLPPLFEFHRAILDEVVMAPSLREACIVASVKPRSIADLKALRDESVQLAKRVKTQYDPSTFKQFGPRQWDTLWVWGGTGLGKTKWAIAQFKAPCFVKPFDSIGCLENLAKSFDPDYHDGLVLDEADLSFMTRAQVIALFDMDEPCTLDVRYKSFTLPAGIKKILISNPSPITNLLPPDPHGAIARRYQAVHVTAKTYLEPQRPPLLPVAMPAVNRSTPPTQAVVQQASPALQALANAWAAF